MKGFLKYISYVAACVVVYVVIAGVAKVEDIGVSRAVAFEKEKDVEIFFAEESPVEEDGCPGVRSVKKRILNAETLGPGAIEKLLLGPSPQEGRRGLTSYINKGVILENFEVVDDVAYLEFSDDFVLGSKDNECAISTALLQIEKTLTSLSDIDEVIVVSE